MELWQLSDVSSTFYKEKGCYGMTDEGGLSGLLGSGGIVFSVNTAMFPPIKNTKNFSLDEEQSVS